MIPTFFIAKKHAVTIAKTLHKKMTMSLLKMGQKTLSIIPDIRFNAV